MKWVTIKKTHVNTNNVTAVKWEDGMLHVFFIAEENPTSWEDPDKKLYMRLCRSQGIALVEEESI